jgi:hypothetical protein
MDAHCILTHMNITSHIYIVGLQYFYQMENALHLRDFQQIEINPHPFYMGDLECENWMFNIFLDINFNTIENQYFPTSSMLLI